jgi:hypothetical protein
MSAGISDRKMSRIVTARKVGMMTAQGVNNIILLFKAKDTQY